MAPWVMSREHNGQGLHIYISCPPELNLESLQAWGFLNLDSVAIHNSDSNPESERRFPGKDPSAASLKRGARGYLLLQRGGALGGRRPPRNLNPSAPSIRPVHPSIRPVHPSAPCIHPSITGSYNPTVVNPGKPCGLYINVAARN